MRVSSAALAVAIMAVSRMLVQTLSLHLPCQTSRLRMFRAKQVFPLRRTSPPAEVSQLCGMSCSSGLQPTSMSDYVSLRAESAVEASVKRAMEPFMSELRTFKVEMKAEIKAEIKEFKAEMKEDLRGLKSDVAELKNEASFRKSFYSVAWNGVSLVCVLSGGGFGLKYLWGHAKHLFHFT
jgi:hypothetical protein